jgi:hypothetical protein
MKAWYLNVHTLKDSVMNSRLTLAFLQVSHNPVAKLLPGGPTARLFERLLCAKRELDGAASSSTHNHGLQIWLPSIPQQGQSAAKRGEPSAAVAPRACCCGSFVLAPFVTTNVY